jgi:hypothetical protein
MYGGKDTRESQPLLMLVDEKKAWLEAFLEQR